jgi:hypothetical protein
LKSGDRKPVNIRVTKAEASSGWSFGVLILLLLGFCFAGCGAPAEPTPPSPLVATAINDLSAHQAGDGAQLTFTMPSKTVTGDRLAQPPAVEILRGVAKPDGSPDLKSFRVVYTIPGSLVESYLAEGLVQFTDPIAPEEFKTHPDNSVVYVVRARASPKRASANSNAVTVRIFPVPEHIASVEARVTETAIELRWSAPARTSAGGPLPALAGYRIYRGELDPASADAATKDITQARWKTPLKLLGPSESNSHKDASFEFGKTYLYIVRSLTVVDGNTLESSDSSPAVVAPRDIFPPAAPQGLVAAVLPGAEPGTLLVDLSWSINLETDLAGYRVYRSGEQGARGQLLTPDLLPTPSVRDSSVQIGKRYWYSVTAVDRAGNESTPSEPVAVDIAQPSP